MARVIKLCVKRPATSPLLPDPEPRPVEYTLISVDDHLMEPPHAFAGRLPQRARRTGAARRRDRGRATRSGCSRTRRTSKSASCASRAGAREDRRVEPARFDEMRPGCFDPRRTASRTWTSTACGRRSTSRRASPASAARCSREARDPELGLACVRAWNDWVHEEWQQPYPERFIPLGITFLADPEQGAAEIRRNARARLQGGHAARAAAQASKLPTGLRSRGGSRSCAACAETGTVLSLHVGSSRFGSVGRRRARALATKSS